MDGIGRQISRPSDGPPGRGLGRCGAPVFPGGHTPQSAATLHPTESPFRANPIGPSPTPPSHGLAREGTHRSLPAAPHPTEQPNRASPTGLPATPPSHGLAREGTHRSLPAAPRPTEQPTRANPIGLPPTPPSNAPRPGGQRRRLPPAAAGGINSNPFFDRLRRPKNSSQPESAGSAGAGRAASPNLGWATGQAASPTPPRHRPSARSPNLPGPSQISPPWR